MSMVVSRDDRMKGTMGKKIARTLVASMVVMPGLLGGSLATTDNVASADTINVATPESLTLYYGQKEKLDFEAYTYRTSSIHLDYISDSGQHYLEAKKPGTYTVYLYNEEIDPYYDNSIDSFNVNVPYPDANGDGVIDVSDIVKYLAQHEYDSEERKDILGWVDSSLKPINVAPTVNDEYKFDPNIDFEYMSYFPLDILFNDENKPDLTYSIVNTTPESIEAIIAPGPYEGGYEGEGEFEVNMLDTLMYRNISNGTTTITVRATDDYGKSVERDLTFVAYPYRYFHLYRDRLEDLDIASDFEVDLVSVTEMDVEVMIDHPANRGSMNLSTDYNEDSLLLRFSDVVYEGFGAVAVIKVDVTTTSMEGIDTIHTKYFKITVYDEEQPG